MLEACSRCVYDGLGGFGAGAGASLAAGLGLNKIAAGADVQGALDKAGVGGDVRAMLQKHGGDVSKAFAAAGVSTKALSSQLNLPPEASAALQLVGSFKNVLKGRGSEGKIKAAADAAQGILDAASGPIAGQVGAAGTQLLTKALKVRVHAAGQVGGAAGTAVGAALLGPAGAAAGRAVGTLVGEGARAVGRALGIKGAKEKRRDLENKREKHDNERFAAFKKKYPETTKAPFGALYDKFSAGQIVLSKSENDEPGLEDDNGGRVISAVVGGQLKRLTPAERADKWRRDPLTRGSAEPFVLVLESNKLSEMVGKRLLDYEQRAQADAQKQQAAAQQDLQKLKQALVVGLVQAAKAHKAPAAASAKKKAAVPRPAPKPAAPHVVKRRHVPAIPAPAVVAQATPQVEGDDYSRLVARLFS